MEERKMSIKDAIDAGYTHYLEEGDEKLLHLSDITIDDALDMAAKIKEGATYWIVDMKNPIFFEITLNDVKESFSSLLESSEDISDDGGHLEDIVRKHDYSEFQPLLDALNNKMINDPYYRATDIELVP
jgi:hypothetical protein